LTDSELIAEIGDRMRRYRLQQNIPQEDLAEKAGVAPRTVRNMESGGDVRLSTIVAVLRALGRTDVIDAFLPRPGVSPIELLETGGSERRRARGRDRG
jgi:transcriptional regulator with XRE-family HTH domain